jgi:hypothetical protein
MLQCDETTPVAIEDEVRLLVYDNSNGLYNTTEPLSLDDQAEIWARSHGSARMKSWLPRLSQLSA